MIVSGDVCVPHDRERISISYDDGGGRGATHASPVRRSRLLTSSNIFNIFTVAALGSDGSSAVGRRASHYALGS